MISAFSLDLSAYYCIFLLEVTDFEFFSAFTQAASLLSATTNATPMETQKAQATSSTVTLPANLANLPLDQQFELLKSVAGGEIVVNASEEKVPEVLFGFRRLVFIVVYALLL